MHKKFKKGDLIGEQYEVFDLLGEGGFGTVYLVYSLVTMEVFALKTCRDEYIEDTTIRERFRKEAQVWIDLERHPYIVRAILVESISDRLYIAIEHIASDEPGLNTLEGFFRNRQPDLALSLRWAIQFCHGMEYAYSKGIKAHRDIKPANIMIDQNMAVKITDFGLAHLYSENAISEQYRVTEKIRSDVSMQTAIGTSIGTPEYMSPEQFEDLSSCDERSDIYSFGIVLYRMAAGGKLPFNAENPAYRWAALKHFHQESNVPKLTSQLTPIIFKCLEKKSRNRYQAFKELRADLEPLFNQMTGEIVKIPELKELGAWELINKGFSLGSLGKDQEAIACYDRALEINPMHAMAWMNKGLVLGRLVKEQEAIVCYDRALEINPRHADTWYNKGCALKRLGKDQEAISCYDRALEINPKFANAWNNKGCALEKLGKDQEAIACYDQALEINPRLANTWINKGIVLEKLDKVQEAIACYDQAIENNPRFAIAWRNKGALLESNGKVQEAIACFDRALEIDPRYEAAWCNKGFTLGRLDKDQEAIACFDSALEIDPKNALAWFNKGVVLGRHGKVQTEIACYEKALEINPNDKSAWYNKGVAYGRLSKNQEAIVCFDKALEINPGDIDVWADKGIVLGRLAKNMEALACFEKALEINPMYVKAWYHKGMVEDKLNRKEAVISLKNFLKLAPNHDVVATVLKRIKALEKS